MTRLAWHFLRANGRLRDGRVAPPDGEWLTHTGPLVPCLSGLHASEDILDALWWAPGPIICRVELDGDVQEHGKPVDKLVAARRCILWRLDAETSERVLRQFARWCALQVIDLWDAPAVAREYLETGDESKRDAAWTAARNAAQDAAWAAARHAGPHRPGCRLRRRLGRRLGRAGRRA